MKKSQAAMEFLLTYGWAIMVVIVAIGALAYFGVIDLPAFLPEKCVSTAGLDCMDKAMITGASSTVEFVIKNSLGQRIQILDNSMGAPVTVLGESCGPKNSPVADPGGAANGDIYLAHDITQPGAPTDYTVPADITNDDQIKLHLKCPNELIKGERFKETFVVPYQNMETGLIHNARVSITGVIG